VNAACSECAVLVASRFFVKNNKKTAYCCQKLVIMSQDTANRGRALGNLRGLTEVRTPGLKTGGPHCCMVTMTDDAAKTRLSPFFEEKTAAAASLPNCHTG
jgi:hypothetical protein